MRIEYQLPPAEKQNAKGWFTFYVFVRPALSDEQYCVTGQIETKGVIASGSVALLQLSPKELKKQSFILSLPQATEVYSWFLDAKFLDPKTKETVEKPVLDGDSLLIEGYVDGRYFRLSRNSGDSPESREFFKRLKAFRVWKEKPNQALEPTSTAVTPPAVAGDRASGTRGSP